MRTESSVVPAMSANEFRLKNVQCRIMKKKRKRKKRAFRHSWSGSLMSFMFVGDIRFSRKAASISDFSRLYRKWNFFPPVMHLIRLSGRTTKRVLLAQRVLRINENLDDSFVKDGLEYLQDIFFKFFASTCLFLFLFR